MGSEGLPRILSPNLGCPLILPAENPEAVSAFLVLADQKDNSDWSGYSLRAEPSHPEDGGKEFAVQLTEPCARDEDCLPEVINDVTVTRLLVSTHLRHAVFKGDARFWSFRLRRKGSAAQNLRTVKGKKRSTLFDLVLYRGQERVSVAKHALCLRPSSRQVRFVHLTDLHVAARNDMWEKEVNRTVNPPPGQGKFKFVNFNDRLRDFIGWANQRADEGELDFVLVLGDLVDFVCHGFGRANPGNNNWRILTEILTGSSSERERKNPGLRLPIFTTLGNHDWRLAPYPPEFSHKIFGLGRTEARSLDYLYHDSSAVIGEKISAVHAKLIAEGSPVLARSWWRDVVGPGLRWLEIAMDRASARVLALGSKYLRAVAAALLVVLAGGGATQIDWLAPVFDRLGELSTPALVSLLLLIVLLIVLAVALFKLAENWMGNKLREKITALIGIETSVGGLQDYFLNINPYFNYAFRVEDCYFLVLDTGHDCLTGQSFWDDGGKKLGPVSIRDNILGGSPDTMAFFPPNQYYHYSQIAWLEAVLDCIRCTHGQLGGELRRCRVFVGVHTPPANFSKKHRSRADALLRRSQGSPVPIARKRLRGLDVRYGSINHYLSEFYYLCLGYKEAARETPSGPGIDVVLAGHAHWSIEFLLKRPDGARPGEPWKPVLYYGRFSPAVEKNAGPPNRWWGPLLLQTGACGPPSDSDPDTPNFREIVVDENLGITRLVPRHTGARR